MFRSARAFAMVLTLNTPVVSDSELDCEDVYSYWQPAELGSCRFVGVWVCIHVEARGPCWVSSPGLSHLMFGDRVSHGTLTSCLDWIASEF